MKKILLFFALVMSLNASAQYVPYVASISVSSTIGTGTVIANQDFDFSITVTGVIVGDAINLTFGATRLPIGIVVKQVSVTGNNTVVITLHNHTGANIVLNNAPFTVKK
jgi:hypothetical protein